MYVILVYDVDQKRVSRINKLLKKYLLWVQNSVFEGELNESLFDSMKGEIKRKIKESDSVLIYTFRSKSYTDKVIIGLERGTADNVI